MDKHKDDYTFRVPQSFRSLVACEKCSHLSEANDDEMTCACNVEKTQYFEGMIAVADPEGSWVAKWQKIKYPGMYSIKKINTVRKTRKTTRGYDVNDDEEDEDEKDDFIASEEEEEEEDLEDEEEEEAVPLKKKTKAFEDDDFD